MPEPQPIEPPTPPLLPLILVPLGLVLIFAGLCVGTWLLHIAYTALYHPDNIPLVGKVLILIDKDDVILEQVKTDTGFQWQGAAVRYGVLMLLLIVVLTSIGSVIRGFIGAGTTVLQAAAGKKPEGKSGKPPA